jgi:membrane protein implicated in regulation of membrane protease activity
MVSIGKPTVVLFWAIVIALPVAISVYAPWPWPVVALVLVYGGLGLEYLVKRLRRRKQEVSARER